MDWLLVFVVLCVVGQLSLPLIGHWHMSRAERNAAKRQQLIAHAARAQEMAAQKYGE